MHNLGCISLKKSKIGFLNPKESENGFLSFFSKQINPRSFGSWCVKGTEESTLGVDSSVPLMHHDPRDLGLIYYDYQLSKAGRKFVEQFSRSNIGVTTGNFPCFQW